MRLPYRTFLGGTGDVITMSPEEREKCTPKIAGRKIDEGLRNRFDALVQAASAGRRFVTGFLKVVLF